MKTTLVFIVLGIAEMISGFISGILSDRINLSVLTSIATNLAFMAIIICILAYYLKSILACYFCGAFWGAADCFFMNLSSIICTKFYNG